MEMMTISEVSRAFNVTPRMLRYYEKIGILRSTRVGQYAYRVYDEEALRRLKCIIILRKLRIPLREAAAFFNDPERMRLAEIFQNNIDEIEGEITALSTIRDVLRAFLSRLKNGMDAVPKLEQLCDADVLEVIGPLTPSKFRLKEVRSMESTGNASENVSKANETLDRLKDVRIIMLPPFTVASYHFIGENPEETAGNAVDRFVREGRLYELKPDARMFGFNHPNPSPERQHHGYEVWVTIPDDMEVPSPLVKKRFNGGMYAAHTITFPDFHEWELLCRWVEESDRFEANYSDEGEEIMHGCLEEHLNWVYSSHMGWPEKGIDGLIDLLLPVRFK